MTQPDHASLATLPQWIGSRALRHGQRPAVTFWEESSSESTWTYHDLWLRSCGVANQLRCLDVGDEQPRALLLYPPGKDFLAALLGCQIAGWVPVPTCHPKPGRAMPRLDSAAKDCRPAVILGDLATLEAVDPTKLCREAESATRLSTSDSDETKVDPSVWIDPDSLTIDPDSLAFLQYTSGSTSEPKGVMVRHRNLMANLDAIQNGFRVSMQPDDATDVVRSVFWLPFFHDMGLIGGILEPLYLGMETVLMSPGAFLQRPIRWLELISQKKASISGAPNFAYQLCVDRIPPDQTDHLDLSGWTAAFCGAEPILARTLQDFAARFSVCGFSSSAFYPCYGLAEATLLAAGGDGPKEPVFLKVDRQSMTTAKPEVAEPSQRGSQYQKLVSCGVPAKDTDLRIVDPESLREVQPGCFGEIWLRGPGVTDGYWAMDGVRSDQACQKQDRFDATTVDGQSGFYRTGDLGFQHQDQLYVTGRVKDLIILRGRNLFPQDIEETVRETIGRGSGNCAAFSVPGARGEVLAIVAELPRDVDRASLDTVVRSIRRSVIDIHDVDPTHVLLTRPVTVPITSSGKVRRSRCRELFDEDQIRTLHRYERFAASAQVPLELPDVPSPATDADRDGLQRATEDWMKTWLIARAGVKPSEIKLDKPFSDYGLDSMTAVEMSGEIEDWSGTALTPIVAWNYPTVSQLSQYIVDEIIGTTSNL